MLATRYVCPLAFAATLGLLPGRAASMGLTFGTGTTTDPTTTTTAPTTTSAPASSGPAVLIDSMSGPPGPVLAGADAPFSVAARDPAGGTLAYAWSASTGTVAGAGPSATLTAPAAAGPVTVTVTVTSTSGSAPAVQAITATVVLLNALGALGDPLVGPQRLARAPEGFLYAVDGGGGFHVLTARGEPMGQVWLPERALAVAAGPGLAWVSTVGGRILRVDPIAGRVLDAIDVGYATGPSGLAWDDGAGLLWLAEAGAGQLRAIRTDGTTVATIPAAGTLPLAGVVDVALDPAAGLVWAALDYDVGQPMAVAFDARTGAFVKALLTGGTGSDQVLRAGGIAVDAAGRVYLSDAWAGRVQVASGAGQYLGALGAFGSLPSQLREPAGVLALPGGEILVANADDGRIERFGAAPAVPVCAGDADCDGMPDAWELAHGLDPHWAGDALLDYDHDGLTNLQEFRLGTDPRNPDTDGDGVSDGDEVAAGTDPLVDGRVPVLTAADPAEGGPGLVRWASTVSGVDGDCSVRWRQRSGAPVTLRGATTFAPSFVARVAGEYAFVGTAACGSLTAAPVTVRARILDVAPRPDPGRTLVVHAGQPFTLDGRFSGDANGDALALRWEQVEGRPAAASGSGPSLSARADGPGWMTFALTATEAGGGLSASGEVRVLALDAGAEEPPAAPAAPPRAQLAPAPPRMLARTATVGEPLELDGEAGGGEHRWRQLAGPAAGLRDADRAVATVVPFAAGAYVFEHAVVAGGEEHRADLVRFVAGAVPKAVAAVRIVGDRVTLDGSGSTPGPLRYRWTQVAGPWVALDDAAAARASFSAGAGGAWAFELEVDDGTVRSAPARVTVDLTARTDR